MSDNLAIQRFLCDACQIEIRPMFHRSQSHSPAYDTNVGPDKFHEGCVAAV